MAKPRKPKNEDQKSDSNKAVVLHQKLCLSIDIDKQIIHGYTELQISVPENGIIGLHADNMIIENVIVDGDKTVEFEHSSHYQAIIDDERRWCSAVSSTNSAADAACSTYMSSLDKEITPNLLIKMVKENEIRAENGSQSETDSKQQNVKMFRIDYRIEKAECGVHFGSNVMHTNNQIRRAHCWFPCMESSSQLCCYDLEFTVPENLVAVSNGTLVHQIISKDYPPRKTYVYKLSVPVSAGWITLAVGPFEVFPDRHSGSISHMCLSSNVSEVRNTIGFFHSAFSHYEDYLARSFPFGSYKQIFIEPEATVSSLNLGASLSIFSSQVLFDEKVLDQTLETRVKLAYALARQWFGVYITAETPNDEWLLDGLACYLTDTFIKRFLGNNEARYRRHKANCAVCRADVDGATALSSSAASTELYGTHCIGLYGKIRTWKSVAVLQMLEKQMGPDTFCKILQMIVVKPQDKTRPLRTLSTKEFRHLANKVGNLERPFLKEFFPRWVGSCGCPVLRMGLSYNKRKNMVELAVLRGCTASPDAIASVAKANPEAETRESGVGCPGMMSIRVHELDGMYDHPVLPMAGETWQLLEIQCHSRLAAKRIQKIKKGSKPDGSDDNADAVPTPDMRPNAESPLLWLRADPEMEYLAEIHFNQSVQMWINQLEKDKDVVAQAQAIGTLMTLPQLSFAVINALNNFLGDSKAFWRVRIEAAFALAHTASEETDWAGLLHLVKFYKSRRFDAEIGLPRPNDFHDFPEYFVLEAIPHAIAMVRTTDKKSPREAVEFVLQLLKYNDNNGNPYSDVYWLSALVQSVGELEFGQQNILSLSSLLKRIDRLLQFDRLMPSYNGILTVSCIRTLTQIALKLSVSIPFERVFELIKPFRSFDTMWQIRIEASRALLDLEFSCKGIDAALSLFLSYLMEEVSLRGQVKLAVHAMRLCQLRLASESEDDIKGPTLLALLCMLESRKAFNNVFLRHHLFCILQLAAGRRPTLHGVPKIHIPPMGDPETCNEQKNKPALALDIAHALDISQPPASAPAMKLRISRPQEPFSDVLVVPINNLPETPANVIDLSKEADSVSNGSERRRPIVKIRVRQSAASSRAEEADHVVVDKSQGGKNDVLERGASSSMSVDAPPRNTENVSTSNQNLEEVNSCHDFGSRMTASIGSVRILSDEDEIRKELQFTAESGKAASTTPLQHQLEDCFSPSIKGSEGEGETEVKKYMSLETMSIERYDHEGRQPSAMKEPIIEIEKDKEKKKKKKDKDKKRRREDKEGHKGRDDPEYLEKKRLKKEKKQKEKPKEREMTKLQSLQASSSLKEGILKETEMTKLLSRSAEASQKPRIKIETSPSEIPRVKIEGNPIVKSAKVQLKPIESSGSKVAIKTEETRVGDNGEGSSLPKIRIKIKRTLNNS
ncbi:transcription initiation factor TFIID subunit 2-like isoform X2 [Papaver somniferum]|uniref:transcription initiation factor TFIID subunit 2-like isoform X2 n=1 Tax=Papaver somniferum TaxID=3469 RepID=UPI000E6F5641|nr:transcription initiation factor TFIID subunit 2-like isoform X2 [Papaver somniferum]